MTLKLKCASLRFIILTILSVVFACPNEEWAEILDTQAEKLDTQAEKLDTQAEKLDTEAEKRFTHII